MAEKDSLSIFKRFKKFLKETVFFKVPKDEKEYVREETLKSDGPFFRKMIIVVLICQIVMFLYKLISKSIVDGSFKLFSDFKYYDWAYLICYSFLSLSCIVILPVSEYFAKKNKTLPYFVTVSIAIHCVLIWAVSITLIDSLKHCELTTFSYVCLAITAFVLLEPWVFIADSLLYTSALLIILGCTDIGLRSSSIISLFSISLLMSIASVVNFSKKLDSLRSKRDKEFYEVYLKHSAFRDELTKIYNRRYLTTHIDDEIFYGSNPSGVVMMDIDFFKKINDKYGHQNGDIVLSKMAEIIRNNTVNIKDAYAVRYGGEEFLIFIPHTSEIELFNFAEKIRQTVEETDFVLQDKSILPVRISAGCAVASSGTNYTGLINLADNNLYEAKNTGRNKVIFK